MGRAMDLPYGDVDRLAKLVPNQLNITLERSAEAVGATARGDRGRSSASAT